MAETTFPETVFSEDKPHATCLTCEQNLVTPADLTAHLRETSKPDGGRSHRARILRLTRSQEVDSIVGREVSDAIDEFCENIARRIQCKQISEQEVTQAIRFYSDFADGWEEWRRGHAD